MHFVSIADRLPMASKYRDLLCPPFRPAESRRETLDDLDGAEENLAKGSPIIENKRPGPARRSTRRPARARPLGHDGAVVRRAPDQIERTERGGQLRALA